MADDKNFIEKIDLNRNGVPDVKEAWLWLWLLKVAAKSIIFFADPEKNPTAFKAASYILNDVIGAIEGTKKE